MYFHFPPRLSLAAFALLAVATAAIAEEPEDALARHFGFDALEVYKFDRGITQLRTADFNGDGAMDIALANNAKSTIEVLLQRLAPPTSQEKAKGVNDLVNPERFEGKKVSVAWQVACLKAADVTGDGHVDLVFTGEPKELVVLPGEGNGEFGQPITRRIQDLLSIPFAMDVADLNGDGKLDIVVLGENDLVVHYQPKEGGVGNSTRFAHSINGPLVMVAADIDGDGRKDIALVCNDNTYPLRVQFQTADGRLGPLHRVKLPAPRNLAFAACLGRKQEDLFGIERVSGRFKRWVLERGDVASSEDKWSVHTYALPGKSSGEQLPLAVGDFTGDGLTDVVAANVDAAQLMLFAQGPGGGLALPEMFAGQIGMRDMCGFDADGKKGDELYVLSPQEETIARSVYDGDRLTFPKAIACSGTPQALAVTKPADGEALVAYVAKVDSKYHLMVHPIGETPADATATIKLELEGLDDPPAGLRWADANQDGREDLLIFVPFGPLRAAIRQEDGSFKLLASTGNAQTGLVKDASLSGFTYADTNGDGLRDVVLAQKAFVRALRVNKAGAWEVVDQYNAPTSDAEVVGVCTRPVPGRARPDLAMYDRKGQEIHYYAATGDDQYTLDRSVQVGALELKAMVSAPLGGKENHSILLADKKRLVVVLPEVPAIRMGEAGVYESSIEQAWLRQVAVGDVNHDGRTDLVLTDAKEHFVEVLTFDAKEALVRATKFRLFARKQQEAGEQEKGEPHWVHVADVTHDGYDDLILIAHDRVLLYPSQ